MRRALMAVGGVICVAVMATTAIGAPVETTDTDTPEYTGALDIDKVTHDHDGDDITYTLATKDADPYAVAGSDPKLLEWSLDFNADDTADACVRADVDTDATLTGELLDGTCAAGSALAGATVTVTLAKPVFTVIVARAGLEDITEYEDDTDDSYGYRVAATSTPDPVAADTIDGLPNLATDDALVHSLAAAASPTPSASSTPSPSASDDLTDDDGDTTTTSDDGDDSGGGGAVLASTTSSGGGTESGVLPATGDVADTSARAWPAAVGLIAVVVGLGLGSVLAYRLVMRPSRV